MERSLKDAIPAENSTLANPFNFPVWGQKKTNKIVFLWINGCLNKTLNFIELLSIKTNEKDLSMSLYLMNGCYYRLATKK